MPTSPRTAASVLAVSGATLLALTSPAYAASGTPPPPASTSPASGPSAHRSSPTVAAPAAGARTREVSAAIPEGSSVSAAQAGAGFLARELLVGDGAGNGAGLIYNYGAPDYGLSADTVFAMDGAAAGQSQAAATTTLLAAHVADYTTYEDSTFAGAVAKMLNVAVAQGENPRDFGGKDLIATLQSLESTTSPGWFADRSTFGDYSNALGQSFALIGLKRAGINPTTAQASALAALQCSDGGFSLYPVGDQRTSGTCTSNPDATSFAVQALVFVNGSGDPIASRATTWLASKQDASGGVGGGATTENLNANSTGLAAQAFVAGGRTAEASKAAAYLATLQYDCTFPAALRGGIAYNLEAYEAAKAKGAEATASDQDRRSTAQALLGLVGVPLPQVTKTGAAAAAPVLSCDATPSPTSTTTTTSTSTTTSTPVPTSTTTTSTTTSPTSTTTTTTTTRPASTGTTTCADFSAPVPSTDPRYHLALDSDQDGVGCESAGDGTGDGDDSGGTDDPAGTATAAGPLATTGADVALPAAIAGALLTLGGGLVAATRRRGRHQ